MTQSEIPSPGTNQPPPPGTQLEPKLPPIASEPLLPNEHLRLLIGLMQPMGIELARRWVAALTIVPADERESVVASVEKSIAREYADRD